MSLHAGLGDGGQKQSQGTNIGCILLARNSGPEAIMRIACL